MDTFEHPFQLKQYSCIDSTNRVALELGSKGAAHATVIVADEQTGGRGRQSRQFISPPGGLYLSIILRPDLPTEILSLVTLAAGAASAKTIGGIINAKIALKWPNDLYFGGKKIGGILVEAGPYSQSSGRIPFVVVGIGINVNSSDNELPESLHDIASSLFSLTGQKYDLDTMINTLVADLLSETSLLESNPDIVLANWRKHDYLLGKQICWQDMQGGKVKGRGKGLMPDGRYMLTTSEGDDYPVLAGDITITEINGQGIK